MIYWRSIREPALRPRRAVDTMRQRSRAVPSPPEVITQLPCDRQCFRHASIQASTPTRRFFVDDAQLRDEFGTRTGSCGRAIVCGRRRRRSLQLICDRSPARRLARFAAQARSPARKCHAPHFQFLTIHAAIKEHGPCRQIWPEFAIGSARDRAKSVSIRRARYSAILATSIRSSRSPARSRDLQIHQISHIDHQITSSQDHQMPV